MAAAAFREALGHGIAHAPGSDPAEAWLVQRIETKHVILIGEVRDWEFGSPPCGWVFAIDVDPQVRQSGVASRLMAALGTSLRRTGVRKLRTLLARDNTLILSFFRSQGMMAAPLIPLELDLQDDLPNGNGNAARGAP